MTYLTTMVYAFIMAHMPVQLSNAIANLVDNLFTNWATGILKSTYNTDSIETATSLVKLSNSVYADLFSIVNSVFSAVKTCRICISYYIFSDSYVSYGNK